MEMLYVILAGISIILMLIVLYYHRKTRKTADKALFIALGVRDRIIGFHRSMDKFTGEVRRLTGEQATFDIDGAEEFDDKDEGSLEDTQPARKRRRRKKT